MTRLKGLALTKYGNLAASTRHRFTNFAPLLSDAGIDLTISPLIDGAELRKILSGGQVSGGGAALAYAKRFFSPWMARPDFIWVQYELFPYIPYYLEMLRLPRKTPLILDYDDAIQENYLGHSDPLIRWQLGGKIKRLQRRAALVTCGNEAVGEYARQNCENVLIVPTSVDTDRFLPNKTRQNPKPVVGWIGSPSTWAYVEASVLGILEELVDQDKIDVLIVGAQAQAETRAGIRFKPWSEETEVADIQSMDIGIMPLQNTNWARGKSGFKLIQYMACGLPVIASPVGANKKIVQHNESGSFAEDADEWRTALLTAVNNPKLRQSMGKEGRALAVSHYSLQTQAPKLCDAIFDVVKQ